MQWFQIKEQSAGEKRLLLSWFLYKIFGEKILYLIAFFVSFFTFLFAPSIRHYSKKYFIIAQAYTGIKPTLLNQFKHIRSYADSLVDKMLVLSGNFDVSNIIFENQQKKEEFFADLNSKKGVFVICNHIGNIEVLQSFFLNANPRPNFNIDIFISNKQSQIFNKFLKSIKREFPFKFFSVENIDLNTGIELKEDLDRGDIVFIAGDRLAQANDKKYLTAELFSRRINLPVGTFKLAKLMEVPTYFVSALKQNGKYCVYLEKQKNIKEKELTVSYTNFLERVIKINPFQFFHFYDFFD